jgi:hypothetical protein
MFWRRKQRPPEVRVGGRATIVEVGSSVVYSRQSAISLRLRLHVVLDSGAAYEVTTAWTIDQGQLPKMRDGASFKVDVVDGRPAEVHPRGGWASWDRTRTPQDTKFRTVDAG